MSLDEGDYCPRLRQGPDPRHDVRHWRVTCFLFLVQIRLDLVVQTVVVVDNQSSDLVVRSWLNLYRGQTQGYSSPYLHHGLGLLLFLRASVDPGTTSHFLEVDCHDPSCERKMKTVQ